MNKLKEFLPYIIILIVVILIRTFVVTPIIVNGTSMYDTLEGKEIMILWKLGNINRFDIVVANTSSDDLIKRVYALPGETIEYKKNKLYINDQEVKDEFAFGETADFAKVTLKEDEYFVMGDNRLVSLDSRSIGPIPKNKIEGTTNFILFPFHKFGTVK